jgi:hypothetical protein
VGGVSDAVVFDVNVTECGNCPGKQVARIIQCNDSWRLALLWLFVSTPPPPQAPQASQVSLDNSELNAAEEELALGKDSLQKVDTLVPDLNHTQKRRSKDFA